MGRIKIIVEFDGEAFVGWQRQAERVSVQGALESAFEALTGKPTAVRGAGRTDSGVHGLAMPADVDLDVNIPLDKLSFALAPHLPDGIAVTRAEAVDDPWSARHRAILRWYRYQIDMRPTRHPLGARAWRVRRPLDAERVEAALKRFEGSHDFSGFRSSHCTASRTRLDMDVARLTRVGDIWAIDYVCRSFLHRMVRLLTGAAAVCGEGKLEPADIDVILETGERPTAVQAAPAEGLCLMGVAYTEAEAEAMLQDRPAPPSF